MKGGQTDLEHDLHLVQLTPGLLACEHLDDEAADGPDVGFEGVGGLTDNLGSHPCERRDARSVPAERSEGMKRLTEDGALEGLALVGAREQIWRWIV